jgi:hypothetical protein
MERIDLISRDLVEALAQATAADEQLAILRSALNVEMVQPDQRFDPGAFYFVIVCVCHSRNHYEMNEKNQNPTTGWNIIPKI